MANDGTVKIGAEIDEKEFLDSLSKLSKTAKSALNNITVDIEVDKKGFSADLSKLGKDAEPVEVPIEADTAKFKKGLDDLEREAQKNVVSLKELNGALELNPKSTDLLIEKQKLLQSAVSAAAKKADDLNSALKSAKASGEVEKNAEAYRKLVIEFSNAEAEAKNMQAELDDVSAKLKNGQGATEDLEDATDDLGRSYTSVGDIIKGVAIGDLIANGIQAAISGIKDLVGELWNLDNATAEYREAQGKLNAAFETAQFGPEAAKRAYSDFYKILGDVDTATEASQLLATLAENERDLSKWTEISAGVFGTFGDALPIEGLIESSNETAKTAKVTGVLADALNWAGISEDAFNDKLAALGTESERNSLIMKTLSETYDDASESFFRNNEEIVKARENQILLDNALATAGETISTIKNSFLTEFSPAISDASEYLSQLADSVDWGELASGVGGFLDVLQLLVPVIAGAATAMIAYKAASSISGIIETLINVTKNQTIAQAALNAVMNANPFVLVATLIAGVVTALTTLYLTNETFRNKVNSAWASVNGTISNSVEAIVKFFTESIPNAAQKAVDWFLDIPERMETIGEDIVKKLWEGITGMGEWLRGKVDGFISGIISAVTGGGSKSSSSGSSKARSAPESPNSPRPSPTRMAPAGDFSGETAGNEGGSYSLTASDFSRAAAVRALESAIPNAVSRVSVSTAAMGPSAGGRETATAATVAALCKGMEALINELNGMKVTMDGRTVGRLVSEHQNNIGRAFGTK
ncbi:MAG: hypothetical protein HFF94_03320 [Oscillibacter sp.]|nr:hypothetical protein [Oscillibacter sp.]